MLQVRRDNEILLVHGCFFKGIPKTVSCFSMDYSRFKDGTMAPYRHDEFPAKLYFMISMYVNWRNFFDGEMVSGPPKSITQHLGDEIKEYRARNK